MGARRTSVTNPNATPQPFKVALDRGSVQVCGEFRQGFEGRGAERLPFDTIYTSPERVRYRDEPASSQESDEPLHDNAATQRT